MFTRLLQLPLKRSYFLFGARNTGKTTWVEHTYPERERLIIDLLDSQEESRFSQNPNELYSIVEALPDPIHHVIIDEVQKVPKLLDIVQRLMKKTSKQFIMTGSSARKLKQGGANLLAGRAFVHHLYPLTHLECAEAFDLTNALQWGTLPTLFQCENDHEKESFLQAYAHTYLKEEIWGEQIIRKLDPFRRFLEVAAQCNGKIINFSNIARDVGVDDKTIKSYYAILEDTLIGFFLDPYHHSFRRRLTEKPKFYFFDTGIVRALTRLTGMPLFPETGAYGNAFEHFIILECLRLSDYFRKNYRFSYLRTPSDVEIDLVVERPGAPLLCIEIKSATRVNAEDLHSFYQITKDLPNSEALCLCQEKYPKKMGHIMVLPWARGLKEYFTNA